MGCHESELMILCFMQNTADVIETNACSMIATHTEHDMSHDDIRLYAGTVFMFCLPKSWIHVNMLARQHMLEQFQQCHFNYTNVIIVLLIFRSLH